MILGVVLVSVLGCQSARTTSLAGQWQFSLDRNDAGVQAQWFSRNLPDQIHLPGSLQNQNFGDLPSINTPWVARIGAGLLSRPKYAVYENSTDFKTPFWLTPKRHYVGVAWYQRTIHIPQSWTNQRVVLRLQRAHWQTTVWVDDRMIGTNDSLGTPHEYDLTDVATPGDHRLTIRVDNRINVNVGLDAHSVSDQTETDWNGIVGDISLRATDKIWIDDVQIYPNVAEKKIHVVVQIGNHTHIAGEGELTADISGGTLYRNIPIHWNADGNTIAFDYALGPAARDWDEFSPNLYKLRLQLSTGDERITTFGMRQISTRGTQFILNGHPMMLRGTLECCIFPLTGYPPTDVASWKRILTIARAHGLNHIRFHSWCPPEEAFKAADELGFYFSVECSCWAHSLGSDPKLDSWITAEAQRMLRAYGNHPSFMFMVPSNEPDRVDRHNFLANLITSWRREDPRRLYTAGSGWPVTPANQYNVGSHTRMHNSGEMDHPPATTSDYRDYIQTQTVPVVVHEMGQWCAYPNFDEIPKYTGYLKPGNLEIFQDFLKKAGMADQAHDFLMASGKFQTLLYKEEIEHVLRTPGMGGFQLLDLHDFPGQGTAPVGVLDAFWDDKPYMNPEIYSRFCNQTVPLARLEKRVFTNNETAHIQIDISHFGPADLENAQVSWRVRNSVGQVLYSGSFPRVTIPTGRLSTIGTLDLALNKFPAPAQLNLEISIDQTNFANDWNFWVYPASVDNAVVSGITITHDLSAALSALSKGGKVLLLPGVVHDSFEPIFWNRITFPQQVNHTLGIFCDPSHPALTQFPTDDHSDWQWWDLQRHSRPLVVDSLPAGPKPIVQMIDDWDQCHKLALIFEARVNQGKLLVCSIDLESDMASRPVARQLLHSLLDYMASSTFSPSQELTPEQMRAALQ